MKILQTVKKAPISILTVATDDKLGTVNRIGDIIRTVLGSVGTLLVALGLLDVIVLETINTQVNLILDLLPEIIGAVLQLISVFSALFNKESK